MTVVLVSSCTNPGEEYVRKRQEEIKRVNDLLVSIYHHVNSIDSRLNKWLEYQFGGVSTKYLQKYLNWFKAKGKLKESKDFLKEFANKSLEDTTARNRYKLIAQGYEELIKSTTQN